MIGIRKQGISKRKEEIVDIKRKINHLELLSQKIVDKFVDNQIDNETFKNAKQRYTDQIKLLQQRKNEIESTDSNFMQYVNYGFSLLSNLHEHYSKASIGIKQKLIGSIFPDKLIYDRKKYRTTKINKVLSLLTNNNKCLENSKKEKAVISDSLSYQAPAVGLEPTSRSIGITATRFIMCILQILAFQYIFYSSDF